MGVELPGSKKPTLLGQPLVTHVEASAGFKSGKLGRAPIERVADCKTDHSGFLRQHGLRLCIHGAAPAFVEFRAGIYHQLVEHRIGISGAVNLDKQISDHHAVRDRNGIGIGARVHAVRCRSA